MQRKYEFIFFAILLSIECCAWGDAKKTVEKYTEENCYSKKDKGASYNGKGTTGDCVAWSNTGYGTHYYLGDDTYHKYCRNPSNDDRPWCYIKGTSWPFKAKWEYCYNIPMCVDVDGQWSAWQSWSACDVTCGTGQRSRKKLCNNPSPQHEGKLCDGHMEKTEWETCNPQFCPIDGQWSAWKSWSDCSATCGHSSRTRIRLCNNPSPTYEGHYCVGQNLLTDFCDLPACSN